MNKYYVLSPVQMQKLQQKKDTQKGGMFVNPEIGLSVLPQIQRLENKIKNHLNKKGKSKPDPNIHHFQYMQMQRDLNRMINFLKEKQPQILVSPSPPTAPAIKQEPVEGSLIDIKTEAHPPPANIMDQAIPTPTEPVKRRSLIPVRVKREREPEGEGNSNTSPRRPRSAGPPQTWSTLEGARAKMPKMKRI